MRRTVFNQKGGVGKTSITCNLASALAMLGRRVLVVDLDSQANSSQYLLGEIYNQIENNVASFFADILSIKIFKNSLRGVVHSSPIANVSVIPSSRELGELQQKLETRYKVSKFAQALKELEEQEKYDEILIDTPPSLNFYSMSALIAANTVLIPFDCDAFSVKAIHQVMTIVDDVCEDHNPDLKIEGVIINQFQSQAKLPRETIDSLYKQGLPILTPYLSHSIAMKESHEANRPLVHLRPNHKLSLEYLELASQLVPFDAKAVKAMTSKRSRPASESALT